MLNRPLYKGCSDVFISVLREIVNEINGRRSGVVCGGDGFMSIGAV